MVTSGSARTGENEIPEADGTTKLKHAWARFSNAKSEFCHASTSEKLCTTLLDIQAETQAV